MDIKSIINPIATPVYECDVSFGDIAKQLEEFRECYDGLELVPDFQRGHVWTDKQKQHYIENVLRGIVARDGLTIKFNCPNFNGTKKPSDLPHGVQCIDGLQRLTAISEFVSGTLKPFGLTAGDLDGTEFSSRRMLLTAHICIYNFKFKAELLQFYIDLNAGGTPHSDAEIERVRKMLEEVKA